MHTLKNILILIIFVFSTAFSYEHYNNLIDVNSGPVLYYPYVIKDMGMQVDYINNDTTFLITDGLEGFYYYRAESALVSSDADTYITVNSRTDLNDAILTGDIDGSNYEVMRGYWTFDSIATMDIPVSLTVSPSNILTFGDPVYNPAFYKQWISATGNLEKISDFLVYGAEVEGVSYNNIIEYLLPEISGNYYLIDPEEMPVVNSVNTYILERY